MVNINPNRESCMEYMKELIRQKLPIYSNYGEYWIEGENSQECRWEIYDNYYLHYDN